MSRQDELREIYASFPDSKLEHLALYEINDLDEEAVTVLYSEMKNRGFSRDILDAAKEKARDISDDELMELVEKYRRTPCPYCKSTDTLLNGFKIKGLIDEYIIGCLPCIKREKSKVKVERVTFSLFPSFFSQLFTGVTDGFEMANLESKSEPSDALVEYVKLHRGRIYMIVQKFSTHT